MLDNGDKDESKKEVLSNLQEKFSKYKLIKKLVPRIILVHPSIYGQVVNDNLEVRTSVSIDQMTGAAVDGALFTYEAIPRSTIFTFELIFNDPTNFESTKTLDDIKSTVKSGMKLLQSLGVGGMTTRGFGRVRAENMEAGLL